MCEPLKLSHLLYCSQIGDKLIKAADTGGWSSRLTCSLSTEREQVLNSLENTQKSTKKPQNWATRILAISCYFGHESMIFQRQKFCMAKKKFLYKTHRIYLLEFQFLVKPTVLNNIFKILNLKIREPKLRNVAKMSNSNS